MSPVDLALAPARFILDRAWYALARRVLPAVDDNLADLDDAEPIPYVLADTFDGKPIGSRLDTPPVRRMVAVGVPRQLDSITYGPRRGVR
jgi:hypothetical protein